MAEIRARRNFPFRVVRMVDDMISPHSDGNSARKGGAESGEKTRLHNRDYSSGISEDH